MMLRALSRALQTLVLVAMAVVATVVIVEVLLRYTLGQSLVVTEELSRYLMVWVAFLGSVLVIRERGHIAAAGLCDWLGTTGRRRVAVVADLLSLSFLLVLAVAGFQVLPAQLDQHLTTMNVPIFWFYLAIPVGASLMALVVGLRLLGWDRVEPDAPAVPEI
jgi:TRAP-type C4-dicarboxylate transport system permease small subunit